MEYTNDFVEAAYVAKRDNLFLGYGNPNGKILIIDKEQRYHSNETLDSDKFYEDILRNRAEINERNGNYWFKNIGENYMPDWDLKDKSNDMRNNNPIHYFSGQKNQTNSKFKEGTTERHLLNAGLQYQKIYEDAFMESIKQAYMNFEKEIFVTYINDLPYDQTSIFPNLTELKKESIDIRKDFLKLPFFKSFSVEILAIDSYPHRNKFTIESIFLRHWTASWQPSKYINSWWHRYKDFRSEKSTFHSSEFNPPISDNLVESLGKEIKFFFENGYYEC